MAEISNPQLKGFCNDDLRKIADLLTRLNIRNAAAVASYNARDLVTIINAGGSTNLITDDSETDGRTRCTGEDVFNFVTLLSDLSTFMTQGRKDVLAKWNVNGEIF